MKEGAVRDYYGNYSEDYTWIEKKCPKCGKQMQFFDGGSQAGMPQEVCSECDYSDNSH